MAQKWEYLKKSNIEMKDSDWGKLGEQGWEIVTTQNVGGTTISYIFKRPKDEKFPEITDTQRQEWANERANSNDNFTESKMEEIYKAFR